MSNNICTNTAYLNSVDQKRRFQLLNIPPVRYDNLASNPYTQKNITTGSYLTKFDLDMRRKAEILRYSSNRMSTQTNSLTKAQKYAQAISGTYQSRTYSQTYIDQNSKNGVLNTCPIVKTSTTKSDVPGPPILLYNDPNIPLYNFINDADSTAFGILNQNENPNPIPWKNTSNTTTLLSIDGAFSTVTSVYIINVNNPLYKFSISTPVSLSISGGLLSSANNNSYSFANAITIKLNKVNVNVKYSSSDVPLNPAISYGFVTPPNISLDISLNRQNNTYSGSCYLGLLNINNIILPVQKGFIYDIQIGTVFNVFENDAYSSSCNTPVVTPYIDISFNDVNVTSTNCAIYGSVPVPIYSLFPKLKVTGNPA